MCDILKKNVIYEVIKYLEAVLFGVIVQTCRSSPYERAFAPLPLRTNHLLRRIFLGTC